MLVNYSSADGLMEGARKTFDGQHPCAMCKAIAAGKQEEQKQPQQRPTRAGDLSLKDLLPPAKGQSFAPTLYEIDQPLAAMDFARGNSRPDEPSVPPPRHGLVLSL
jgi:hypothetical protein